MAIGRPEAIDAAPAPQAGAQRRMAAGRLSCFARNGRSPGEESRSAPLRHRRSRRSRPTARSAHQRGRMERSIRQKRSRRTWRVHRATEWDGGVGARRSICVKAAGRITAPDEQGQACDQPADFEGVEVRRAGQSRDRTLPRPMGQRDPALIHPQIANRRGGDRRRRDLVPAGSRNGVRRAPRPGRCDRVGPALPAARGR
jgi:hypothetical protein